MFNLVLKGQIEVVKKNTFKGEDSYTLQFVNINDKVEVLNVKMLKGENPLDVKTKVNCELDVKLFTPKDKSDIYYSQLSPIKYLK